MARSGTSGPSGVLADLLAPPTCMLCSRGRAHLCHECASELRAPPPAALPTGLDHLVVLCAYEGAGSQLVLALKRHNRRGALPLLGAALADAVGSTVMGAVGIPPIAERVAAVVTWAPTTPARHRARGFDQSRLLARSVAGSLGLPCRRLLRRRSREVTGATRSERLGGVSFGVSVAAVGRVAGKVVLVDDVVTSGATMSAAASALRSAGATSVTGVALARTPPGAPRQP